MDSNSLRAVLSNLSFRLTDEDRKRLRQYLGNQIPKRIRDDPTLDSTLRLMDNLFDQNIINEEDCTFLINAFDEIQCRDAADVLREHQRCKQINERSGYTGSVSDMSPVMLDRLFTDSFEIKPLLPTVNIPKRNAMGNNNIMVNSNNVNVASPSMITLDPEWKKTVSESKSKLTSKKCCRKQYVLFNILTIGISVILIGYLVYKSIFNKTRTETPYNNSSNQNNIDSNRELTTESRQTLASSTPVNLINNSPSTSLTHVEHDCSSFVSKSGWNMKGNDLYPYGAIGLSYSDCCAKCAQDNQCNAFTWHSPTNRCYLKSSAGIRGTSSSHDMSAYLPGIGEISFDMSYQLINVDSKKALDIINETTLYLNRPQAILSHKSISQTWFFRQSKNRTICLIHKKTGKALTFHERYGFNWTGVLSFIDGNSNSQSWRLKPVDTGHYKLIDTSSGKVLQTIRQSKDNGVTVELWQENESMTQRWDLIQLEETITVQIIAGGQQGNLTNSLQYPHGIAVDENQTMYIADCNNHRIVAWKINATAGETLVGGTNGDYHFSQLYFPTSILFDHETKSLLICDDGNRRVVRWSLNLVNNNSSNDQMQLLIDNIDCGGLALDKNGFLYVSDNVKHEVRRYEKDGDNNGTKVAGSYQSGQGLHELNEPSYLFVDDEMAVYISDSGNHRVVKWIQGSSVGIRVAGGNGIGKDAAHLSNPRGIWVNQEGDIFVVDSLNNRIMLWEQHATEGVMIAGGDRPRVSERKFYEPDGLYIDHLNHFYIADKKHHRIQLISVLN